jgi:membrane associated rhomboid family serine protease
MVFLKKKRRRVGKKLGFFKGSFTFTMILVNVILFFVFLPVAISQPEFFSNNLAVKPSNIVSGGQIWTVLTSMFMHGSFLHLFVNMFTLFFLGMFSERIIGRKRLFWLYMISGIVGSLVFVSFAWFGQGLVLDNGFNLSERLFGDVGTSAVGASGALFGLLGLLAVLIPKQKVYLIVGPLVGVFLQVLATSLFEGVLESILYGLATVILFLSVFAMFSFNSKFRSIAIPLKMSLWLAPVVAIVPLVVIGLLVPGGLPIGNTAHFGGLVVGLIYGAYLRNKYPRKVTLLGRMFG